MRKTTAVFCIFLMLFLLAACGTSQQTGSQENSTNPGKVSGENADTPSEQQGTIQLVIGDDGYWYEVGYNASGVRQYVLGYYVYQDILRNQFTSSNALYYSTLTHPEEFNGIPFGEDFYNDMLWCSFDSEGKPDKYVEFESSNMGYVPYDYRFFDHSLEGHNGAGDMEDELTIEYNENGQMTHIAYVFHNDHDGEYWDSYMDDYFEYDENGNMAHSYRTRHGQNMEEDEFVEENWFDYDQDNESHIQIKSCVSDNYRNNKSTIRSFDENGNILVNAEFEYSDTFNSYEILSLWSYEYDSGGRLLTAKVYFPKYLDEGISIADYILEIQHSGMTPLETYTIERDTNGFALSFAHEGRTGLFNPLYSIGLNVGDEVDIPGYGTIELVSIDCKDQAFYPNGTAATSGSSAYQCYLTLKFTNKSGHDISAEDIKLHSKASLFLQEETSYTTGSKGYSGTYYFQSEDSVKPNETLTFLLNFSVDYPLHESNGSYSGVDVSFVLFNKFTIILHPQYSFIY